VVQHGGDAELEHTVQGLRCPRKAFVNRRLEQIAAHTEKRWQYGKVDGGVGKAGNRPTNNLIAGTLVADVAVLDALQRPASAQLNRRHAGSGSQTRRAVRCRALAH
jgi:hypothetical protein